MRAGDHLLAAPAADAFLDGSAVSLVCRPEAVRLLPADAAEGLPARIAFVRDVGSLREAFLDAPGLGLAEPLVCELSGRDPAGEIPLSNGAELRVALPPGACHVFPAGG